MSGQGGAGVLGLGLGFGLFEGVFLLGFNLFEDLIELFIDGLIFGMVGPVLFNEILADFKLLLDVRGDCVYNELHYLMHKPSIVSTFVDCELCFDDYGLPPFPNFVPFSRVAV